MEMNNINESVLETVEETVNTKVLNTLPDWDCFLTLSDQISRGASYRYIELLADAMNKTPGQLTSLDIYDKKYRKDVICKMIEEFSIPDNHRDLETFSYSDSSSRIFCFDVLEFIEYLFMSHGISKAVSDIYGIGVAKDNIINREMDLFLEELMNEDCLKMDNFIIKAMSHINSYSRKVMNKLDKHIEVEEEEPDEIG